MLLVPLAPAASAHSVLSERTPSFACLAAVAFAAVRCNCSQAAASTEFLMRVAYVEIYNEMCRDLLDKHSPDNMQESPPHRTAPYGRIPSL